jgi:MFS family permease
MTTPPSGFSPAYRRLLLALLASNLGDGVALTAFPLLCLHLSGSAVELGALMAAQMGSWLLVSFPAGALIDRTDPRRLMVGANSLRVLLASLLVASLASGLESLVMAAITAFALGAGEVFFDTSAAALIPRLVDRSQLTDAGSRQRLVELLGNRLAGAALGAALFSWQPIVAFAAMACLHVTGLALLRRVPSTTSSTQTPRGFNILPDIRAGMRYVLADRTLTLIAAINFTANLALAAAQAMLPLLVREHLQAPEWALGAFSGALGLGAFAAVVIASRAERRYGTGPVLASCLLALPVGVALAALPHSLSVALAAYVILGLAETVWAILALAFRQRTVPVEMLGRSGAFMRFITYGSLPLGSALSGLLVEHLGFSGAYAAFTLILVVPWLFLGWVTRVRADDDAAGGFDAQAA